MYVADNGGVDHLDSSIMGSGNASMMRPQNRPAAT